MFYGIALKKINDKKFFMRVFLSTMRVCKVDEK